MSNTDMHWMQNTHNAPHFITYKVHFFAFTTEMGQPTGMCYAFQCHTLVFCSRSKLMFFIKVTRTCWINNGSFLSRIRWWVFSAQSLCTRLHGYCTLVFGFHPPYVCPSPLRVLWVSAPWNISAVFMNKSGGSWATEEMKQDKKKRKKRGLTLHGLLCFC